MVGNSKPTGAVVQTGAKRCTGSQDGFIAYAVQRFPALRTTFIRREVEALRDLEVPLQVISMRPPDLYELHGETEAMSHLGMTHYLPRWPVDFESVYANLWAIVRHPAICFRNWKLVVVDPDRRGSLKRLRVCLQIWRGAIMARRLSQLGTCRHIHAQFADGASTTALVASRLLCVPFSFSSHTSYDPPALHDKLRSAAFVASISEVDRQQLIEYGGENVAARIRVIRCGIPLDNWPFRPKLALNDPVGLLSVGALIEKKGHDILIEACSLLKPAGVRFNCEIIGEGPLRNRLERLIVDLNVQDVVKLVGALPQSQVHDAVYRADLFVLACKRTVDDDTDGIPVSLMEAMAAGVPVVSTRISGIPELIVDDHHGVTVKPGSARDLADAIENLLQSGQRLRQLPTAARARIESVFNQQKEAEKLAELFTFSRLGRTPTATRDTESPMGEASGSPASDNGPDGRQLTVKTLR